MDVLLNKVNEKISEMRSKFKVKDFNVAYDLKSVRTLCSVKFVGDDYTMNLNKTLLKEFEEVYINEVVVHEFAHIVIKSMFPNGYKGRKKVQGHGREWKRVCCMLGLLNPKSTTSLFSESVSLKSTRKTKTYEYNCGCQTHDITKRRHNLITNKGNKYLCTKCKNEIKFVKENN